MQWISFYVTVIFCSLLPVGGGADVFSREAEGQHSSDKFRVARNSLDIFSPVRDGERILFLQWFAGCTQHSEYIQIYFLFFASFIKCKYIFKSNCNSVLFLTIVIFNISFILDYKGHRLSDASNGKKGDISIFASVMTEIHDKMSSCWIIYTNIYSGTYLILFFCIQDLDFLPQHGSAQRKNPLGTPGARCYSPLSAVHTPPAIKEEEPVITSPTHTDAQNNLVGHWHLVLYVFKKQP